jgi:hypothetical protein
VPEGRMRCTVESQVPSGVMTAVCQFGPSAQREPSARPAGSQELPFASARRRPRSGRLHGSTPSGASSVELHFEGGETLRSLLNMITSESLKEHDAAGHKCSRGPCIATRLAGQEVRVPRTGSSSLFRTSWEVPARCNAASYSGNPWIAAHRSSTFPLSAQSAWKH